jgi:signal transduction histidine kinase
VSFELRSIFSFLPRPRRLLLAVLVATLAIFAGLIAMITWQLRGQLRTEVLHREAEAMHAVALLQLGAADTRLAQFGGADFAIDDLFATVLESSRLRGVLAVQLFDGAGRLREAKPLPPEDGAAENWWGLAPPRPAARFVARGTLERVSPLLAVQAGDGATVPLLDIAVPLQRETGATPLGVARYWMDGEGVAAEFARLDRSLVLQAGLAFAGGAALVLSVLVWAFARLADANRRLLERSADLARANEELDFAAKTGALGAISAHLIHGLKNPLAGIEGFVFETVLSSPDAIRGDACRTAIETTRRLRSLVAEVTTVLKEETEGTGDYLVSIADVVEAARGRGAPAAEQAGIELGAIASPDVCVTARVANLAGLVLANLIANAIEAAPRGATIALAARPVKGNIEFLVRDTGPGIPEAVQAELFRPVRSAKPGGGGVGLAISLRLARHAGGNLELLRSTPAGSEFRLTVPAASPRP